MNTTKYLLIGFLALTQALAFGQQKGAAQIQSEKQSRERGNTYAVVVGISDYQDPGIPDLRFADKDAEAFANFLRSDAGGKLDDDHLKILINSKATMAQFAIQLDWLMENAKENDRVFIYFSGHGDVEKKTITQPGYLLCWDAPARVYLAGGAMALPMFQDVISTLSAQNKAKVIVITDACRSGKLSGSNVGGAQITGSNLAKQYANEIKILSCQPNEYSIEGEQWGGGRGAFSYHLIDALYGMADQNQDQLVSVFEIGRYLEDHVTPEVAPQSQLPMIIGNKAEKLTSVFPDLLVQARKSKNGQLHVFAATESRGMEEEILAGVDTSIRIKYQLFKISLKEKKFFEPLMACSEYYYQQLIKETGLTRLHSTMKRNYAAALQDDAQQVINKFLKAEIFEVSLSQSAKIKKYKLYPKQLEKAANLLGRNHYMYKSLQSRRAYFEGFSYIYGGEYNEEIYNKGIDLLNESLSYEPDMPLSLLMLEYAYGILKLMPDSAEYYAIRANDTSEGWVLPFTRLSDIYSTVHQFSKAKYYIDIVRNIDSTNPLLWEQEAYYYFEQKMYDEAEKITLKLIENQPSSICMPCSKNILIEIYIYKKNYRAAEEYALKLLSADSTNYHTRIILGKIYTLTNRTELAKIEFREVAKLSAIKTDPNSIYYYWLGYLYAYQNKFDEAFKAFETAIKAGYTDYGWMQQDPDYQLMRNEKEQWNNIMKKYFPDQYKDK